MLNKEAKKNPDDEVLEIFDKLFKYIPDFDEKNNQSDINIVDLNVFLDDFRDMAKKIKCPICSNVSLDSGQCSKCSAIYCKKCIKEGKILNCPFCQGKFSAKEIDRILVNLMGDILMYCEKCKKYGKQQSKIKLSQIKEHLSKCNYSNYQCLKCNTTIFSKKKCIEHSFNCGYADEICTFCKKIIKA